MKIVADQNIAAVEQVFAELGAVSLVDGRALTAQQVQEADVLLLRSVTRVDAALLQAGCPGFIATATSGYDHIDRELLAQHGAAFAHAPGSNADSVVDYVLSALAQTGDVLERLLAGERYGIVGYGHIGRRLGVRLQALGIRCVAYDPWLDRAQHPALGELDEVLDCAAVSFHAALQQVQPWPSYHLLSLAQLQQLAEGAVLINAGRGELLANEVLLALAQQRPDLTLVLDVWEGEPRPDPALLEVVRFGTAHIAGYSADGKLRATAMLYRALLQHLAEQGHSPATLAEPPLRLPAVTVDVPADLQAADLLRWLLLQVYDIRDDDVLLRKATATDPTAGFDLLRKQYRQRRELGALQVNNFVYLSDSQQQLCLALGCTSAGGSDH